MTIKYIANARIPTEKAHGYQITKMCEEFARAGADVELIVPRKKSNHIKEDAFSYYGLERNFRIRYLDTPDFVRLNPYIGRFSWYLQVIGYLANLAFLKADEKSVIYTRDAAIAWLMGLRGYRSFYEAHAFPGRYTSLYENFLKKTTGVIVLTQFLKRKHINLGVSQENILVEPDAVDMNKFDIDLGKQEARQKLGLPLDRKLIGYTGNFRMMGKDKGLNDILKALQTVPQKNHNHLLVAVGGSEKDIQYYSDLAKELGVDDRVQLMSRVDLAQLAIYQKAFDIMVMSYPDIRHYREHLSPLKLFEYMASQRPIVASDLPSITEILNSQNSFLCQPDDPDDLARQINFVLGNPEEGEKRAVQAYKDVQEYTWEKRAERVLIFMETRRNL